MVKQMKVFSYLCLMTLIFSCGKKVNQKEAAPQTMNPQIEEEVVGDIGFYSGELSPLNEGLGHGTRGSVKISIDEERLGVTVIVAEAPPMMKHRQAIMTGRHCPALGHDVSGDGVIDFNEARTVVGDFLIPLDSHLGEQFAGIDFGPIANELGEYVYRRSTSFSELLSDLRAFDPDLGDHLGKLSPHEELKLTGRVVMIFGAADDEFLPIACGKLIREKKIL